jgi:hypothetical protein
MKRIVLTFVCLILPTFSVAADSDSIKEGLYAVTVASTVQNQIAALPQSKKEQLQNAIDIGNKFAPHHFDGTAYAQNDIQEEKIWKKDIQPLISSDRSNWNSPNVAFPNSAPDLIINGRKVTFEVVCPKFQLISANTVNDHFELTYRTKIIGMWKSNSTLFTEGDILVDEKEEFDEVLINLDSTNRVSKVTSKYAVLPTLPKQGIDMFAAFIARPYGVFVDSPSGVIMEPKTSVDAKVIRYKQFINLIKNEEASACK